MWSHNTSQSRATKFTPFKLLFGEEAILLEEIIHKSPRVTFTEGETSTQNEELLTKDFVEELRCQAVNNLFICQAKTTRWRNKKVNPREINFGDMVLIKKTKCQNDRQVSTKMAQPLLGHSNNQTWCV
jgi:hypothetical protein